MAIALVLLVALWATAPSDNTRLWCSCIKYSHTDSEMAACDRRFDPDETLNYTVCQARHQQ
jgi:hypothetical protein